MTYAFNLLPEAAAYVRRNTWLVLVAAVASIALMCVIICKPNLARKVPQNYFLLFGFTISYGFLVALVGASVDTDTLTAAVGTTVIVTSALILFACQTKYVSFPWLANHG
jgi:FtsH-binding integral membrane protein